MSTPTPQGNHIFIGYARNSRKDEEWAQWIAQELKKKSFTTELAWNNKEGGDYVARWNKAFSRAKYVLVLFSRAFLAENKNMTFWTTPFSTGAIGEQRKLIPVRIESCTLPDLLQTLDTSVDIFGIPENDVKTRLFDAISDQSDLIYDKALLAFPGSIQGLPQNNETEVLKFPGKHIRDFPKRNRLFTEHHNILTRIDNEYQRADIPEPIALYGPSGIGKTQLALEYMHSRAQKYSDVLWIHTTSDESWAHDIKRYAKQIAPTENIQHIDHALHILQKWLQNKQEVWLAVFDDVRDLSLVSKSIPSRSKGHVLLTTRIPSTSQFATPLPVNSMTNDDGALFLLRRAGRISANASLSQAQAEDIALAQKISELMGGLALALDQAGALIESSFCSLQDCLDMCNNNLIDLLKERGIVLNDLGHPTSVFDDFQDIFEELRVNDPIAAAILQFCSLYHPAPTPKEIFIRAGHLLDTTLSPLKDKPLMLHNKVSSLYKHSCLQQSNIKTLTIYPLIHVLMKHRVSSDEQRVWAEQTVRAVVHVCEGWEQFDGQQLKDWLPHIHACKQLRKDWHLSIPEAHQLETLEMFMIVKQLKQIM